MTFRKPPTLDLKLSVFRAFWTIYDHYSDQDPTYNIKNPNKIENIRVVHENEWILRRSLAERRISEMRTARNEWEVREKIRQLALEEEAKKAAENADSKSSAKSKKKAPKRKKKAKEAPDIEPPLVPDNMLIDVDEEFLLYEEQYLKNKENLGPNALLLNNGDVNLRSYQIVGGLCSFHYIKALPQFRTDIRHEYLLKVGEIEEKLTFKDYVAENDDQLLKFIITLPDTTFWWEEPVVCKWVPWEESQSFKALDDELQDFHLRHNEIMEKKTFFSAPIVPLNRRKVKVFPDFDLNNVPPEIKLHFLFKDYIVPRLPERYKTTTERFFDFLVQQARKKQAEIRRQVENDLPSIDEQYRLHLANDLRRPSSVEIECQHLRIPGPLDAQRVESKMTVSSSTDSTISAVETKSGESVAVEAASILVPQQKTTMEMFCDDIPRLFFRPKFFVRPLIVATNEDLEITDDNFMSLYLEAMNAYALDEWDDDTGELYLSTFLSILDMMHKEEEPDIKSIPRSEGDLQEERMDLESDTSSLVPIVRMANLGYRRPSSSTSLSSKGSIKRKRRLKRKKSEL
jgi:cancer susceptibility candidate protein 1